ncbi:UvrD-helicase domain-containing protein [Shouchella tritolerans]|uniref:UvrD-helicase domain-containing protein n=1 Tax=Shouchella tritolerans TaxID=2979466 RepID=UPI0021E7FAFE|nr:UvrD-helicase domain-containing protein [Shouchella tritolerans]
MQFNSAQKQAIESNQPLVVVAAGAGSGKTRVLTEKIVSIIAEHFHDKHSSYGAPINEIAAITFTEKAAREMKERLANRMGEKAEAAGNREEKRFWLAQQEEVETAMIATFHRFCRQLLSRYSRYAEENGEMAVLDETEAAMIKAELVEQLCKDRQFANELNQLRGVLSLFTLKRSLVALHDAVREQRAGDDAISQFSPPYIWNKQINGAIREQQQQVAMIVKAVKHAAKELPPLHQLSKTEQKHAQSLATLVQSLALAANEEEAVAMMTEALPRRVQKAWQESLPSLYFFYEHKWKPFKKQWGERNQVAGDQGLPLLEAFVTLLQAFAKRYAHIKAQRHVADFSDLQQKAYTLLQIPNVAAACQSAYTHIMVDEFQDTNQVQLQIVQAINPAHLFFVGDEKQSIYRFRGADVAIMNEMAKKAAKLDEGELIHLQENYRTAPQIVELVNELFAHVMAPGGEDALPYATHYVPLKAGRKPHTNKQALASFHQLEKSSEARSFASLLQQTMADGIIEVEAEGKVRQAQWNDVAVLLPSRTNLPELEQAFAEAGIPYRVHGGVGFFAKQEVIDFLNVLNWLRRPFEDAYVVALLRSPLFGLTLSELLTVNEYKEEEENLAVFLAKEEASSLVASHPRLQQALKQYGEWIDLFLPFTFTGSVKEGLLQLFEQTGLRYAVLSDTNGIQRVGNVEKLIDLFAQLNTANLETMCLQMNRYIAASKNVPEAEVEQLEGEAVTIMTVHASKGLEFPVVCLPYMDQKRRTDTDAIYFDQEWDIVFQLKSDDGETISTPAFFQAQEKRSEQALEESKRLFYVALTRAKDYCLFAAADLSGGRSWAEMIGAANEQSRLSAINWVDSIKSGENVLNI